MTLGYCPRCGSLVTIVKAPVRFPGQREAWKTGEHDRVRAHDDECLTWDSAHADCNCGANGERCPGVGAYV